MYHLTLSHNYESMSGEMRLSVTDTRTGTLVFEAWESFQSPIEHKYECFLNVDGELVVARSYTLELPPQRKFKATYGLRFRLLESVQEVPMIPPSAEIDAELKKLGYWVETNKMMYVGKYESDSYPAYAELFKYATD